ncbi:glycosidase [bacterium]|nr:MAG: glycosidase [bacterium]
MIHRHPENPILSYRDVPYPTALAYNGSVIRWEGRYVMLFRNDHGSFEGQELNGQTDIGLAFSDDGVHWEVDPEIVWKAPGEEWRSVYDPRLCLVEGRPLVTVAMDTAHGLRGGIATTEDFRTFEMHHTTLPDNRDLVLFPEKIDGMYVRLDRPFLAFGPMAEDGYSLWMSRSPDLKHWGEHELVLGIDQVPYANDRIGAGSPPVRTEKGWLVLLHTVDEIEDRGKDGWEEEWKREYSAAALLLDLKDPSKVVGLSREPIFRPEATYEVEGGYRNHVVFPTSLLVEGDEARIYYAAADSWCCLATASLHNLVEACVPL